MSEKSTVMKKKTTPFAHPRADNARTLNATSRTGAAYPSFAEILAASDLRTLVKRASARVFGPAVVAGAVGLGGCSSAADFYSDLIEPPAPQTENPIEMHELPKPSDPMPHVGPVGVEPMEPCPLPETPPEPVHPVETSMVNPPSHPPVAPGGIRPVHPSYQMPGGAG